MRRKTRRSTGDAVLTGANGRVGLQVEGNAASTRRQRGEPSAATPTGAKRPGSEKREGPSSGKTTQEREGSGSKRACSEGRGSAARSDSTSGSEVVVELMEATSDEDCAPAISGGDAIFGSSDRILRFLRRRLTDTMSTRKEELLSSYQMTMRPKLKRASEQVEEMISDVVEHGNSTSILLIGDRGAGKTLALDSALRNIQTRFNNEESQRRVGIVRLNGLVTSGDRAVLKDIALQICELFDLNFSSTASYEENICFLKQSLEQIGKEKAVVFVLDELDALTQRTKQQTTLYNLFDALQSASVLACIVGVTTRHDVIELLEKRVQSRFSHRKIHIPVPQSGKATCGASETSSDPTPIDFLKEILLHPRSKSDPNVAKFNSSVVSALSNRSLQESLTAATAGSYSTRWLCNVGLLSLAQVDRRKCVLEAGHIQNAMASIIAMEGGQENLVPQLSVLQLYLLVAFCRLLKKDAKYSNFQTALNEYTSLLRTNSDTCEKFSHSTALRAFEDLISCGMIGREGHTSTAASPLLEYQQVCLLLSPAEIESGLKKHPNCPSILQQWLAKEAVARFDVDVD